ncbi:nuclease-related domain-containing protein [Lederbergia citrea]|uniref:nuclease-related domain-containing protein n=1 Tax=Lederbergia citrea TaxID=2833581 RepID=UPI001BCA0A85|nr:nuclease-related domain-containing protein [Lederbergia citrea]MBS4204485.1 NERD domain-containing protein [Lederbergia citrea]
MIKKMREMPVIILKLEALLRRLSLKHQRRKSIEEELAMRYAGFRGEQALDYHIAQIPQKNHFIFQDLRLPLSKDSFFQIDILLLSQQYFIILEAKNIAGTIFIDQNQLLRTLDEKEDSYPNPIQQVENQQYNLDELIENHCKIKLPSTSFVAMTNPSSIIKPNPQYSAVAKNVIRPAAIRQRFGDVNNSYQKELIEKKEMQKLSRLLIGMHTPSDPDILKQFQIGKGEILTGIYCDQCNNLSMTKRQRVWDCTICSYTSKNAHIQALIDYRLLIGPTISCKQCSSFFQISSSISSKLLRSLNLNFFGEGKNRAYKLELEDLQKLIKNK